VTANRCYPRPHVSGHGRSGGSGAISRRSVLSQLASQLVIGAKAAPKSGLGSAAWVGTGRPLRCRGTQPPNGLGTSLSARPNTQASSCVSAIGKMRPRYAFFVAAKVLAAGRSSYRLLEAILIIGLTVSGLDLQPAPAQAGSQPASATVGAAVAVQSAAPTGSLPSVSPGAMVTARGPTGAAGWTGGPIPVSANATAAYSPAASQDATSLPELSVGPAAGTSSNLTTAGAQPAPDFGSLDTPGAAPKVQMAATHDSAASSRTSATARPGDGGRGSDLRGIPAELDVPVICSEIVFQPLIAGCSSLLGPITGGGLARTGTPVEAGLIGLLLVLLGAVMYRLSARQLTRRVGRSR
jgi:hypothetical protein